MHGVSAEILDSRNEMVELRMVEDNEFFCDRTLSEQHFTPPQKSQESRNSIAIRYNHVRNDPWIGWARHECNEADLEAEKNRRKFVPLVSQRRTGDS